MPVEILAALDASSRETKIPKKDDGSVEIARMKETYEEGQKSVEHYFDELFKKE